MEDEKVSVIIPLYNVGLYIQPCIQSVLSQTYKNLQIILVNDGSTDNTEEVISKYKSDNRFVIINKPNGGASSARNAGLEVAEGEYIYFIDSDDSIMPHTVGVLVNNIKEFQSDFCCYRYCFKNNTKITKTCPNYGIECYRTKDEIIKDAFLGINIKNVIWKKFFRRDFLKKNKIGFLEGTINEDYLFTMQCAICSSRVSFCNDLLYCANERQGSVSRNIKAETISSLATIYNGVESMLKKYGIYHQYKVFLYGGYTKLTLFSLFQVAYRLSSLKKFIRFYKMLADKPYMKYFVGKEVRLAGPQFYLFYLISLRPVLFYSVVRILKYTGYHIY